VTETSRAAGGFPAWWPRVLPFALFIVLMAAEPWTGARLGDAVDARWLYAVRSAAVALVMLLLWGRYGELRGGPSVAGSGWRLAIGVGLAVFVLWILLDFPPFVVGESEGFDPRVDGRIHTGLALTRLAGSALVVPVMEELFWRSFILRWVQRTRFLDVDPRSVGWKALLISSAVFALEHRLWLAGFLAGLAYGLVYKRTGSLWAAIVAHAVTNGVLGVWVLLQGAWGFW
jgi:CAAX prenyl protease-like protein